MAKRGSMIPAKRRQHKFTLMLSPDEAAALRKLAESWGFTASQTVRLLLLSAKPDGSTFKP